MRSQRLVSAVRTMASWRMGLDDRNGLAATGTVPFDPGLSRLFLRFKLADGVARRAWR